MTTSASTPPAPEPTPATCPRCHKPIPPGAAHGLCPACLLAAGFFTQPAGPESDAPPPAPEHLASEFPQLEIIELLGRGGMGAVYKARQRHLDRLVALKLLRPGLDADPSFAERFTREARSLAQLNHPGIVTLHESGRTPGGLYFIVMEFVDGVNLRQLLAAGRLAPREALAIVPPLCDALQYAHDHGLVHRDIKPENILMDRLGRVKIADFGLAKLAATATTPDANSEGSIRHSSFEIRHSGAAPGGAGLTEAGKVMGTPRYMAPEQRERPAEVDHRADIYALGVVLYQMLTGELPDEKQLRPPSHRVQLDVRLDEIVLRALEKNPALRYAAASELRTRIETLGAAGAGPAKPTPASPLPAAPVSAAPLRVFFAPWLGFAALYVLMLGLLALTADSLPGRVASHFDGDGRADGWMSRAGYLLWAALLPPGVGALFAARTLLTRAMPARWINLPHREHWLAPERRAATAALLGRWLAAPACLLVLFFAQLHVLVIMANQTNPPRLPGGLLLAATIGLLFALMLWLVGLVLRFAEPAASAAKLRRLHWSLGSATLLAVAIPVAPLIDEWHDLPAKVRRQHADPEPASAAVVAAPFASRFAAALPGGGYVELLGMAVQPSDPLHWWAPDGAPLGRVDWQASYPASWPISSDQGPAYSNGRQFVFHADGPGQPPRILDTRFSDADGSAAPFVAGLVVTSPGDGKDERWSGRLVPVVPGATAARLRVLVADGALQRLAERRFGGSNHSFHALVGDKRIIIGEVFSLAGKAAVPLTAQLGGEIEWVLRAEDSNGGLHDARIVSGGSSDDLLQETLVFDGLRPADVVELALWTRPAHWVEFDDISLQPGALTAPSIQLETPEAPPDQEAPTSPDVAAKVRATEEAREWLNGVDAGRYAEGWRSAAPALRSAMPEGEWVAALASARAPLKKVASRAFASFQETTALPGAPAIATPRAVIQFFTRFADGQTMMETVTLDRDPNGSGRVSGYLIRPRTEEENAVVGEALGWLAGIDAGRYAASWEDSAASFRGALSSDNWRASLEAARRPLGELKFRLIDTTRTTTKMPNGAEGRYVIMTFNTAFGRTAAATETVTFERERDGRWRASGYFIR